MQKSETDALVHFSFIPKSFIFIFILIEYGQIDLRLFSDPETL